MGNIPTAHTVRSFDAEINQLRSLIGQMGGLAEAQIADAVSALLRRDADAAREVGARDAELDAMEAEAERLAVTIIAVRAPMADDLREIVAALKISAVIERIGDYGKNIAKRVPVLAQAAPIGPMVILPEMANYWTPAQSMGEALVAGDITHDNAAEKTDAMNTAMNTSAAQ